MSEPSRSIRLGDLAHTRSGDKGDRSNIGVVARDAAAYAWLEPRLTEAAVAEFLRPLGIGAVRRYELPRIHAFNFVIEHALAGGASRSLRLDTQGKALGTILLEMTLPADPSDLRDPELEAHECTTPDPRGSWTGGDPDPQPARAAQRADSRACWPSSAMSWTTSGSIRRSASVVVTGAGAAFCSGMDLKEAAEMDATPDGEHAMVAVLKEFADLLHCLHTLPKPSIAAVNGDALAGGAGLMSACDMAVAAETVRIGYPEVRRGLVAVDRHARPDPTGRRPPCPAAPPDGRPDLRPAAPSTGGSSTPSQRPSACLDEAIRIAQGLVGCGPTALATTKRLLDETEGRPPNLRGAAAISAVVRASEEAQEGITAFVEKRPPRWLRQRLASRSYGTERRD